MKKTIVERLVDNCFQRLLIVAKSNGADPRMVEAIETERENSKNVIRLQLGQGGGH